MEFAYLDESGDLGGKGSKYLVLTLLCTHKKQDIIKIIREAKQRLLGNNKCARWLNKHGGEIKFYSFPDKTLLKHTLKKLANIEMNVYFMCFKKEGNNIGKEVKPLIVSDLFEYIFECSDRKKIDKVIADIDFFNKEKTNHFLLQEYKVCPAEFKNNDEDIKDRTCKRECKFILLDSKAYEDNKKDPNKMLITIEHHNSKLHEELQAIDLISGSIFMFYENENREYLKLFDKSKVKIRGEIYAGT
ncbi:MAG: DUF3800 domain-containing protein [Nanoarchaeota archaeon]|nr:DUF3800 domain-containing protein [Nanoarchaeota archaeon]